MPKGRKGMATSESTSKERANLDELYMVPAVDRAFQLLTLLSHARREMPLAEITRELKLPHATALRLVYTMERHGVLRRTPAGYEVGPRVLTFGFEYLASQDIVAVARPGLTALCNATGVSANLAVRDGREIIYLCHVAPVGSLSSRVEIGSRLPAHASSTGRVLLSGMEVTALTELYSGVALAPLPDTVDSVEGILAQSEADRRRGWVLKHGVFTRDLVAIAAPIFNGAAQMIAAINISGSAAVMGGDGPENAKIQELLVCARQLSGRLGL